MDAVDAVLARMRADQGVARDRPVDADVDEAVAASPAALARERAAMRALAGTFREETEDALGRRWYAHFERWLCARRDATRDGDAIPSAKRRDALDGGLARSLAKAGRTTGEIATTTRRLARAAAKARANASARASDGRKNRVRARRIEVGGNGTRKEKVELTCGKVTLELNLRHYETLKTRWRGDARRDEDGFHRAVFCVVARYATLQGTHYKAGNMQAAIPSRVFETLEKRFDVRCELFASPLNAHFKEFCSASAMTDRAFGSLGNAFDFEPSEGSFECNPPFDEEIISRLAGHVERLLSRAKKPLSFFVVVPLWHDSRGWMRLAKSVYCVSNTTLEAKEHAFVSGAQHSRIDQLTPSAAPTSVLFLQNKAGEKKWPVTPEGVAAIREAFAPPKKEAERVEKWDPDATSWSCSRRLPKDANSWVYKNKKRDQSVDESPAKKTKKKKSAGGGLAASFFRD